MPKRVATSITQRYLPDRACKKKVKYDTNWNNMPNEMKAMIMKNMDLITRISLKMCSKSDKCLVEAFPMVVKTFYAKHQYKPQPSTLKLNDRNEIELRFSHGFDNIKVYKNGDERKIQYFKNSVHALEAMENYLYNILLAKNIRIESFYTEWNLNEEYIPDSHMFCFEEVRLSFRMPEGCVKWLKRIAPGVKKITIDYKCDTENIGKIPCVLNARYLSLHKSDINDEQMLNFKATRLTLRQSNVTIDGIKKLIKKWIDENYPIGSNFDIFLPSTQTPTIKQLIDGEYDTVEKVESMRKTTGAKIPIGPNKVMCFELITYGTFHRLMVKVEKF